MRFGLGEEEIKKGEVCYYATIRREERNMSVLIHSMRCDSKRLLRIVPGIQNTLAPEME